MGPLRVTNCRELELVYQSNGDVHVAMWQNEDNFNLTNLSDPQPLFDVGCPAGKVYFFDEDRDGTEELFVLNAYGDLDGMLESQLYTGTNTSSIFFDVKHQGTCNSIKMFHQDGIMPWRDGLVRPKLIPSGSLTLNISGCISDIDVSQ